jgi:hypothetical protein
MNRYKVGPLGGGEDDASCNAGALLQLFFGKESSFASGITDNDTAFLGRLNVGLEVTPDAISHRHKRKFFLVKDVAMLGSQLEESFREAIVVLLLLDRVVECRMSEVLFAIGNQKGFELKQVPTNESDKGEYTFPKSTTKQEIVHV